LAIVAILIATGGLGLAIATRSEPLPQTRPLPVFRAEPVVASLRPVASFTTIADPQARSVALFEEAGRVIQHPRCLNCHPRTDRPTQTDAMRPHTHWVSRGPDNAGAPTLRCATCHNDANFDAAGVPGNSRWTLAPIEMAWQGRSLGEICRQILDPARSHMSREELLDHMAHDELVGWAWHPGADRAPAPGTQAQFGALIAAWLKSGARCPA
jgi:hypothetical protein